MTDKRDPRYPELDVEREFDTPEQEIEYLKLTIGNLLKDLQHQYDAVESLDARVVTLTDELERAKRAPVARLLDLLRDLYTRVRKMIRDWLGR